MIFNLVCVFSHSGSHCAKITIILHLSWLHWISAEQNNQLTARWWCSRIHMSREWALYGQVGVRLCRSLATGGVSKGAWLTHMKANLLLVLVLCCCLGMLTTNVTSARCLALCPLSSTPAETRRAVLCHATRHNRASSRCFLERGVTQLSLHAPAVALHEESAQGD